MYALNFQAAYGPPILLIAPVVGANATMLVASWRAWRACPQVVGQRFWRAVTASAAVSLVGTVVDFRAYLDGPIPEPSLFQAAYALIPMLILLWAMYRLPLGARNRGERQRLMLDIATVALGAVVFIWYFARTQLGGTPMGGQGNVISAVVVLISLIVFGLVKVVMSGSRAVHPLALRLFAGGLMLEVVGMLASPALADRDAFLRERGRVDGVDGSRNAAGVDQHAGRGRLPGLLVPGQRPGARDLGNPLERPSRGGELRPIE